MSHPVGSSVQWRSPKGEWVPAVVVADSWHGVSIRLPGNDLVILAQRKNIRRLP